MMLWCCEVCKKQNAKQ